jgi:hypothetical protein
MVSYWAPFFGSMVEFGMNPVKFLAEQRKKVKRFRFFWTRRLHRTPR